MRVERVQLDPDSRDTVRWSWENNGEFSACSAYEVKFWGREVALTTWFIWKSRHCYNADFSHGLPYEIDAGPRTG